MPPILTSNHCSDALPADAINVRNILMGKPSFRICFSYIKNVFFRELGAIICFSYCKSSLFNCVSKIVSLCSNPQMMRIHARWIVAMMQNKHSIRNGSVMKNPTRSMGLHNSGGSASFSDPSVCCMVKTSDPNPTTVCFVDLRPKSFWECFGKSLRSKVLGCNLRHIRLVRADWVTGPSALLFSQTTQ